jgi:hypothetical protein
LTARGSSDPIVLGSPLQGFWATSALITELIPESKVDIWDQFPPRHGIEVCKSNRNIHFISSPQDESYDALSYADALKHVRNPLELIANMVAKVRLARALAI